jgi:hypothetical protein
MSMEDQTNALVALVDDIYAKKKIPLDARGVLTAFESPGFLDPNKPRTQALIQAQYSAAEFGRGVMADIALEAVGLPFVVLSKGDDVYKILSKLDEVAPNSKVLISHIEFGGYQTLTAGPGTKLRFTVNGEKMWVEMWEATNFTLKKQGLGGRTLFEEALKKFPDVKEIRGVAELDNLKAFKATGDINKTPFALSLRKLGFTRFEVLEVSGDVIFIAGR